MSEAFLKIPEIRRTVVAFEEAAKAGHLNEYHFVLPGYITRDGGLWRGSSATLKIQNRTSADFSVPSPELVNGVPERIEVLGGYTPGEIVAFLGGDNCLSVSEAEFY